MTEPDRPSSNPLIGSDRVEGTAIYSVEGKHIGAVKRLMIEKVSGKVVYVVMTFSGFSDVGVGDLHRSLGQAPLSTSSSAAIEPTSPRTT